MTERRRIALEDLAWIFYEHWFNRRTYGVSQVCGMSHGIRLYPTFAETLDKNRDCLDLYERQAYVRRIA